jgi:hypothetical protein
LLSLGADNFRNLQELDEQEFEQQQVGELVPERTMTIIPQRTRVDTKSHTLTKTNPIHYPSNLKRISD